VDGADEHLGHSRQFAESLSSARDNALFQLSRGLFGKREGNDVAPA
jgi:hypothetical protein